MQPSNTLFIKTLSAGWRDKDSVMLHACFQLLTDFVENELSSGWWLNWEQDEAHSAAKKEIDVLYAWWKEWKEVSDARGFIHTGEQYEKENEMLKRLIDVRGFMWT